MRLGQQNHGWKKGEHEERDEFIVGRGLTIERKGEGGERKDVAKEHRAFR